jgi:hypothetical protein
MLLLPRVVLRGGAHHQPTMATSINHGNTIPSTSLPPDEAEYAQHSTRHHHSALGEADSLLRRGWGVEFHAHPTFDAIPCPHSSALPNSSARYETSTAHQSCMQPSHTRLALFVRFATSPTPWMRHVGRIKHEHMPCCDRARQPTKHRLGSRACPGRLVALGEMCVCLGCRGVVAYSPWPKHSLLLPTGPPALS